MFVLICARGTDGMKHTWILLAMSLYMAPIFLGEDIVCHYHTGNCYTVQNKKLDFVEANSACGPKRSLTTMKDEQEVSEIVQLVSMLQHKPESAVYWIGLYRQNTKCVDLTKTLYGYAWISGGDDSKVDFWTGTPKITCLKKRCVALQKWSGSLLNKPGNYSWAWKDYKCSSNFSSLCRFHSPWNLSMAHGFTGQNIPDFFPKVSKITVLCKDLESNQTLPCKIQNGWYSCMNRQCSCYQLRCTGNEWTTCLQQCLNPSNISCNCSDIHMPCDQAVADCADNISSNLTSEISPGTALDKNTSTTSTAQDNDEDLFDTLFIPLILGFVALGILGMLVWGGVQMCVRKKKPPRKKSIVPVVPEGSDTNSTDHSSSEEEEEEEEEEDPQQQRTETP